MKDRTLPPVVVTLPLEMSHVETNVEIPFYKNSRERFESYAAVDDGLYPPDPWSRLQVQLYRWQLRNFNLPSDWQVTLGIIEELGELEEALDGGTNEEIEDAIGDVLIYCCQLCTLNRLDFASLEMPLLKECEPDEHVTFTKLAGRLAHTILKHSQKIRGIDDETKCQRVADFVVNIFFAIEWAVMGERGLMTIFHETAEKVLARDWKRFPKNGVSE